MPSVVSEASVSSHHAFRNGKRASGPSQGDQTAPFEALLDTAPENSPKKSQKTDRPEKSDRTTSTRRPDDADRNPSDPASASAETDTAQETAATPADSEDTQRATETDETVSAPASTATDPDADIPETPEGGEIAAVPAITTQPAAQPVAAPVIVATTANAPPAAAAEAGGAGTELAAVAPTTAPSTDDAKVPQAAPVEAAMPDQASGEAKPETVNASPEKLAADKPLADKAQTQAAPGQDAVKPDQDLAQAQKKTAPSAETAEAKPDAPAKPKAAPDTPRVETDFSPRDHAEKPAADTTQTATLTTTQTQAAHAASRTTGPDQPLQASQAVPVAGLAVEIAAQSRAGKNRFEIRLDPPELGRIDVRLDMDKDGNVTSRMIVERSETLDLLRRDAQQLERALNQAGLKTSDNALEFSLRDQGFANNDNNRENGRGNMHVIADEDSPAPDAARGYGRLLGLGNGLDIRV